MGKVPLPGPAAILGVLALPAAIVGTLLLVRWRDRRFRLTVTVDTPEGPRTGSSVIRIRETRFPKFTQTSNVTYRIWGEAVAVDLPGGETLYAALTGRWRSLIDLIESAAIAKGTAVPGQPLAGLEEPAGLPARLRMRSGASGEASGYPVLIRFRDPANPETVEIVDPERFGAGLALRSITIRRTRDPVTRAIEARLPWLADRPNGLQKRAPAHIPIGDRAPEQMLLMFHLLAEGHP
ncbi:MAG: hypothetical protein WDN24_01025 [Sphingomonas sp.]